MTASVTIFHNVVWSRHKGAVLSALHNISGSGSISYSMVQIADTEHDRLGFSDVDYSFHRYPMQKLYNGCYEDVPDLAHDRAAHVGSAEGEVGSRRAAGLSPPRVLGNDGRVHPDRQAPRGVLRFDRPRPAAQAC